MKKTVLCIITLYFALSSCSSFAKDGTVKLSPKATISTSFADIIEDLLPTVVNISALQNNDREGDLIDKDLLAELPKSPIVHDFKKQLENQNDKKNRKKIFSIGSGFLISKDGLIVTNNHVINRATEISVSTNDGRKYKAQIIGVDEKSDLALLKINGDSDFKFAKFGDSNKMRIGDWLIVVGNPYGLGGSVSVGIVSARSRNVNDIQGDELIQTDAAINKGNSGGPMFNIKGEVVGISSAIFSPSGGNVGIGFATPSESAERIINQLKEKGEVTRGWIGISVQEVDIDIAEAMKLEEVRGAFVNDVTRGGPADKAGIIPSDVILEFNGSKINLMKDLPKLVASYQIDKTAQVKVWRNGEEKSLEIKVEKFRGLSSEETVEKKRIIKPAGKLLGLTLSEIENKIKKGVTEININGLIVNDIDIKSEAAKKGVLVGDIIVSANKKQTKKFENLEDEIEFSEDHNEKVILFIKRGEKNISIILKPE
jgi:serine protease Do